MAVVAVLVLAGAAEDKATQLSGPWAVIVMVCGVSLLVEIGTRTHGIDLFTRLLASIATAGHRDRRDGVRHLAHLTHSTTSGVVYPAFVPAVPGLVTPMGGGDPLEIVLSINVRAAPVDVSPLSTLGGLCLAAAPPGTALRLWFRVLLLRGFALTFVSAIL